MMTKLSSGFSLELNSEIRQKNFRFTVRNAEFILKTNERIFIIVIVILVGIGMLTKVIFVLSFLFMHQWMPKDVLWA